MNKAQSRGENVFKNRNYLLVFLGALVSELGAILYSFAVSFYLLEISGNDAFLQGLYLALCGAVMLVFTPIGGVLGDRLHKGKIMAICDYAKGGLILLSTLLMLFFRSNSAHIAILFGLGLLGNAVSGIFSPAASALLPHIVDEDRLQQANAYFSIRSSLQGILGVVLAGVLYAALSIQTLFVLVGVCYVISGVSEMFIRYEHRPSGEKLTLRLAFGDMREGLRYLKAQKALMALMAAMLFINFFFAPVTGNFLPYFIKTDVADAPGYLFDRLLTPELWSSVFSVLIGISSLIGAALLSVSAQQEKCGFKMALELCGLAAVMIGLSLSYWLLVDKGTSLDLFLILFGTGCLVTGFLISYINIPASTVLMRVVDRDKLSKVSSIISIASQGLIPIASVLAGAALQYMGSAWLLALCALGFTATALSMLFNRRVREI